MFVFQLAKEYRRGRRKGRGKRGRPGAVGPPGNPGPQVSNCVEINESMDMLLCSNAVAFFSPRVCLGETDSKECLECLEK